MKYYKKFFNFLVEELKKDSSIFPYYLMQSKDRLEAYTSLDESIEDIFYIYNFETDEVERGDEIQDMFSDSQLILKTYKEDKMFTLHFDFGIDDIINEDKKEDVSEDYLKYIVEVIMYFFNKAKKVKAINKADFIFLYI